MYNALIAAKKASKENEYARAYWKWYRKFFIGGKCYAKKSKTMPAMLTKDGYFQFDTCENQNIYIPVAKQMLAFWYEFPDLLLPYVYNNQELINDMYNEGPYELGDKVCLKEGDVVIDCGANLGLFSAIATSKGCIAYAFEPSPSVRQEFLEKTAKKNGGFSIQPYALGEKNGIVYFEEDCKNMGGGLVTSYNSDVKVEMLTLDYWAEKNSIQRIDFIKADIEGAERYMLKGARRILKELHPKLSICTYHFEDDKEVLEQLILEAEPAYKIEHKFSKLYAYVPEEN